MLIFVILCVCLWNATCHWDCRDEGVFHFSEISHWQLVLMKPGVRFFCNSWVHHFLFQCWSVLVGVEEGWKRGEQLTQTSHLSEVFPLILFSFPNVYARVWIWGFFVRFNNSYFKRLSYHFMSINISPSYI